MITAQEAIKLLQAYIKAEDEDEVEECKSYCDKLYDLKKANGLKMIYYDDYYKLSDDESLYWTEYFEELIDLLDDEEALRFHIQIAKDLIRGNYETLYGEELFKELLYDSCPLLELWKRTWESCEKINYWNWKPTDESCEKIDIYDELANIFYDDEWYHRHFYDCDSTDPIDIIPRVFIVSDAFFNTVRDVYSYYSPDRLEEPAEYQLLFWTLLQYKRFDGLYDYVNPWDDLRFYVGWLKSNEALELILIEGLMADLYDGSGMVLTLRKALENEKLGDKILSFILDICNNNDLAQYHNYDTEEMQELAESLTESERNEFLMGIVKHPNVTKEILEILSDAEDEEVADAAYEKLEELEG